MVAMLPARLAAGRVSLRVAEPPLPVAGYEMAMYWHERSHRDPAHRWLRERIRLGVTIARTQRATANHAI